MVGYAIATRPAESIFGVLTVAAGLPLYWFMRRRKNPQISQISAD
jgi:hypothetical protein